MNRIKEFLMSLSFRTGIIILLSCIPLYVLSFAQMSLPISSTMKWVLWVVLFGAAKTTQYAGLTILGVEGVKRLKRAIRRRKALKESTVNS
jgi:phosphoglycolate phosphatase